MVLKRPDRSSPRPDERRGILIIDDDYGVREVLSDLLVMKGFHVYAVETGEAGVEVLKKNSIELVLLDLLLPGMGGTRTLAALRTIKPTLKAVLITGMPSGSLETSWETEVDAILKKPFNLPQTIATIERLAKTV